MRILWPFLALLLIAAIIWCGDLLPLRPISPPRSDRGAAPGPGLSANHQSDAGHAVRAHRASDPSTKLPAQPLIAPAISTGANAHELPNATAPNERHSTTGSTGVAGELGQARAAGIVPSASAPATQAIKPAAELFEPFIGDNPNQVFAPATVNYHAAVRAEAQDPDWGPAASAALRDYVATHFGDRFEIPYVDCRQDLCELQVAGRAGGDLDADMHDIQDAMNQMKYEPWWATLQFDQENGLVTSSADGRVILLWFLSRK